MTRAIGIGAAVVLAVGVPVSLVANLALDDGSDAVFVLAPLVVVAFLAGGWLAATQLRPPAGRPLVAGAAAAFVGYGVVIAVAQLVRVARDEDAGEIGGILASIAFASACGLLGAALRRGAAR